MIRLLNLVLISSMILLNSIAAQSTESYIVLERYSRKVLLAAGSEQKRPIASLSHMVTAKVALDWLKISGTSGTNLLVVPNHNFNALQDNPLKLQVGDQLSIRDALYATILGQDRVSSYSLAFHVGTKLLQQRQMKGDPQKIFVTEMNRLADTLLMRSTKFSLDYGNSEIKKTNISTASDLARLSCALSVDTAYSFYAKQKFRNLGVNKRTGGRVKVKVTNSNKMLNSKMSVVGLKVGSSIAAGQCASLLVDREFYVKNLPNGEEEVTPVQMILVVLGTSNLERFAKNVIPQGWRHYDSWRNGGYMSSPNRKEFLRVIQNQ